MAGNELCKNHPAISQNWSSNRQVLGSSSSRFGNRSNSELRPRSRVWKLFHWQRSAWVGRWSGTLWWIVAIPGHRAFQPNRILSHLSSWLLSAFPVLLANGIRAIDLCEEKRKLLDELEFAKCGPTHFASTMRIVQTGKRSREVSYNEPLLAVLLKRQTLSGALKFEEATVVATEVL